ncbi:MAG TPA: amino acid adenylation domain-containing protein [Nevskiaceae bacterium]|nr:amino acid adenylation domain-containing protein [Nevskiaceae bacterium]
MNTAPHDPFAGPVLQARLPLTEAQREVWLSCQLHPEAMLAYNEGGTLSFEGPLEVAALRTALQTLIERHEALRGSFSPDGRWMMVREPWTLALPVEEIGEDPARRGALEQAEMAQPFDLERGPLIRWRLLRESPTRHHLIRVAHHAIFDGWSAWVLAQEAGKLYSAQVAGQAAALDEAPRYGDYAETERAFVASAEGRAHLDYWLTLLRDPPAALDLPHDRPRPAQRRFAARRLDVRLDASLVGRLRRLGAQHNASLVATTLAGFATLLHRLTGAEDLIVALAAAGQSFHQQGSLVGHAVNLLPLRLRPRPGQTYRELLAETRGAVLDAFDHQGASFGSIVPQLAFERDPARPPLISAVFNIDVRSGDVIYQGVDTRYQVLERQAEVFDLFFNLVDNGQDLVLEASYNAALFSEDAMRQRLREYQQLLEGICADPGARLAELPLIDAATRQQLLEGYNPPAQPRSTATLDALLLAQAERRGSATAVLFGEQSQPYEALAAASARIAARLRALGAGPGTYVAVLLERSLEVPAALLGVLRSGAAYVALDPIFPAERVRQIVERSGACALLTQGALLAGLPALDCPRLTVEEALADPPVTLPAAALSPADPAYVVFTSGSTGTPKGVVLSHGGVVNCLQSLARAPGLGEHETALAVATLAFDFSVYEIFLPLLVGARLLIADRESTADGERLRALIERHEVSSVHATPATMRLLQAAGWNGRAGFRMVFGGEPLPPDLVAWLLPRIGEVWNIYGPTEITITSNLCRVESAEPPIPIGPPIANTRCYVVDALGQLQPPGVPGELWIGGAGVGLGYLHQPALTAERFGDDPFQPGGRIYRSGDLARWRADGQLECLGRIDQQVKLRGYRIELGEIEHALCQHPAVAEAVCGLRERSPGDLRLVAWYVAASGTDSGELRRHLREQLPAYMVPQSYLELPALPRLANGKIDRRGLPDPYASERPTQPLGEPPRAGTEQVLAELWQGLLGVGGISREDRFFDLGGHSLLAVQLSARIQARFGRRLPLRTVMMDRLAEAAAQLGDSAPAARVDAPPSADAAAVPPAPRRGWWVRLFGR